MRTGFLKNAAVAAILVITMIQGLAQTVVAADAAIGGGSGFQQISGNGAAKPSVTVNDDGSWNVCWLEGNDYYCKGYNASDLPSFQKTKVGDIGNFTLNPAIMYGRIYTVSVPQTGVFYVAYNYTLSDGTTYTIKIKRFSKDGNQLPLEDGGSTMDTTVGSLPDPDGRQALPRYLTQFQLGWNGIITLTETVNISTDGSGNKQWNAGFHVINILDGKFTVVDSPNRRSYVGIWGWGTDPYYYVPQAWCRHTTASTPCIYQLYHNADWGGTNAWRDLPGGFGVDDTWAQNWTGNRNSIGLGVTRQWAVGGDGPGSNGGQDSLLVLSTDDADGGGEIYRFRHHFGNSNNPHSGLIRAVDASGNANTTFRSQSIRVVPRIVSVQELLNGGAVVAMSFYGFAKDYGNINYPYANTQQGLQVWYWDGYYGTNPKLLSANILPSANMDVSDVVISRNGKVVVVK